MEEGDLIYVDYDVWVMPDEENEEPILFDTTDKEKAEEEDIFEEDAQYEPRAAMIGGEELSEGFEEALKDAEVGEEGSAEVPPEKGVGNRDPDQIELFSRREMKRRDIEPVEGKEVEIDNRRGQIIQATAGRVRIDFNHPLAGKTLRYDFEIVDKAETTEEKVDAILKMNYSGGEFDIEVDGDDLAIILPEECKYDQNWFVAKYRVVGKLRDNLEVEKIRLIEEYVQEEGDIEEELEDIETDLEEEESGEEEPSEEETAEESEEESEEKEEE